MNDRLIPYLFECLGAFLGAYGYSIVKLIVNGTPIKWLESLIVSLAVCIGFGIYHSIVVRKERRLTKPKG